MSKSVLNQASGDYQTAREALQAEELALRDHVERVAEMRRALPPGPAVKDYEFDEGPADLADTDPAHIFKTRLSDLFGDHDTLIVDHLMFAPGDESACPMCSMWADSYNSAARHVMRRASFAVVARADIGKLRAWARARGWGNLRFLSSLDNSFNADFEMESGGGAMQFPGLSVFTRDTDGAIRHRYTQRAMYRGVEGEWRGLDLYTPAWHLFDLTPDGRGDWMPSNG